LEADVVAVFLTAAQSNIDTSTISGNLTAGGGGGYQQHGRFEHRQQYDLR
jgi:hypothetical protein